MKFDAIIVGAGAWGTAMSLHLARKGMRVLIWANEPETASAINSGMNEVFLPKVPLPKSIFATADISELPGDTEMILFAVPTQFIASVLDGIPDISLFDGKIIINLAKGIERATGKLPSEIIESRVRKSPIITLSGPSFAEEVALGMPTVLVAAGDIAIARRISELISTPELRIYTSKDRRGVELSGALKNVLALAAGIARGLGLGENGRAALIVRGLAEMNRLNIAAGADPNTVFGIAGLGDLVLTSTSEHSRNFRFGEAIGKGENPDKLLHSLSWIPEGYFTAPAAVEMARRFSVELPISEKVLEVIEGRTSPVEAVRDLMSRPLKEEFYY